MLPGYEAPPPNVKPADGAREKQWPSGKSRKILGGNRSCTTNIWFKICIWLQLKAAEVGWATQKSFIPPPKNIRLGEGLYVEGRFLLRWYRSVTPQPRGGQPKSKMRGFISMGFHGVELLGGGVVHYPVRVIANFVEPPSADFF